VFVFVHVCACVVGCVCVSVFIHLLPEEMHIILLTL